MLLSLLSLVALAAEPTPAAVVVPPAVLLDKAAPAEPVAPVPYTVDARALWVEPIEGAVRVRARVDLRSLRPGWVDLPLIAGLTLESATVNGAALALPPGPDGWRRLVLRLDGPATIELVGRVPTTERAINLQLAAAARTRIWVDRAAFDWTLPGGQPTAGGFVLGPQTDLRLTWAPTGSRPARPLTLRTEVEAALRGEAGEAAGSATLRWRVANGEVGSVSFRLPGAIQSLEVEGHGVEGFVQQGDRVDVRLSRPERSLVTLAVRWRAAAPTAAAGPAPVPMPLGGAVKGFVSVLRGDDSLLVPEMGPGLKPTPQRSLPPALIGRLDGKSVGAYVVDGASPSLRWSALSVVPVEGPPTVVDRARYDVYLSPEGGLALNAELTVRNDRSPYLRLRLPPGSRLLGAKVAGRVVNPVTAGPDELWIPLEKSIETVSGLVSLPVELMVIGRGPSLMRRGRVDMPLPVIEAPVNAVIVELHLPEGVRLREIEGSLRPRGVSSGELLVGRANRAIEADEQTLDTTVDRGSSTQSVNLWNQAYSAYKDNRFDEADSLLEQSLSYDPSNSSAQALRGNVDILLNKAEVKSDDEAASRRLREMARARSMDEEAAQATLEKEAAALERAGDVDGALEVYGKLVEVTNQLAAVEQVEELDQKDNLRSYQARVSSLSSSKARKQDSGSFSGKKADRWASSPVTEPEVAEAPDADADIGGLLGGEIGFFEDAVSVDDVEAPEEPEPVAAATEDLKVTLTQDRLESVPVGRSFQSVVQSVPGVVVTSRDKNKGNGRATAAKSKVAEAATALPPSPPKPMPVQAPTAPPATGSAAPAKAEDKPYDAPAPVLAEKAIQRRVLVADEVLVEHTKEESDKEDVAEVLIEGRARPAPIARTAATVRGIAAKRQRDEGPSPIERPTSLINLPEGVSAATLTLAIPRLPQTITLEQQLLAPNQPLHLELRCSTWRP